MEWVKDAIIKMLKGIANNALIDDIVMKQTNEWYGLFDSNGMVTLAMNALKPVGFAVCALFFFMAIYDLAMSERLNLESFMKFFTKLACGVGAILFSKELVDLGFGLTAWIGSSDGLLSEVKAKEDLKVEDITLSGNDSGLGLLVSVGLIALLLQIVFAIVGVCITIVCFSRIMELALRASFMPVAIGFVTEDGWKGAGGRYLKRFIALCIQGPALVLISKIHSYIVAQPLIDFCTNPVSGGADLLASVIPLLGASFAAVGLCFKSIGVINDVFGA